jgi:hypothetical protein
MGPQTRGAISVERRARVAVLLLLSGFDPPLNQNGVDSLYRGLAPSRELKQRIEVLDPARVKEALSGEDLKLPEARHIATKLGKDLDASAVLIIKLQSKESTISIEAELIEAASGESLGKESREPVTGGDITGELRASVSELLERAKLEK